MQLLAGLVFGNVNQRIARSIILSAMTMSALAGFGQTSFAQNEASGAAIMAIEEKADGAAKATFSGRQAQGKSNTTAIQHPTTTVKHPVTTIKPSVTRPPGAQKDDGFILGDKYTFLNFEITTKVQPVWTLKAKNAGASGLVQVEVLIDKNGNVLTAKARTGNALLHPEAERAALATKFNQPTLYNKPVKAMGFVVYRFGKPEEDDDDK